MKKILFAMAALAALASCQKADLTEQNSANTNGERVITAYFDNAGTKTTLDGVTPKWSENDKIMLLDETGKQEIPLKESNISADGKSVTITTTLEGTIYAVYPSNATSAEKVETANVPVTLSAENQDGTFASANICVAKENDGSLAFKNVTSVLHLTQTATTTKVNEIIITTPSAYIAGTGTVDMSATTPALTLNSGLSKKIKVKSASVKSDYYIAVAPTTLPEGTAFGFATGSQLGGTNLSEEKTIAANTIYHIGSMDADAIDPNTYHDYVEIGGLKWATMNVGATSKTDAGHYFAWGYAEGCVRNTADDGWVLASDNTTAKQFNTTDFPNLDASSFQDAATANWGGSWRIPTKDEFNQLKNAVYWTRKLNTGSYVFKPDATHAAGGKSDSIPEELVESEALLFFPFAGSGENEKLNKLGINCSFWSSTTSSDTKSNSLIISVENGLMVGVGGNSKYIGYSVRPVSD